MKNRSSEHPSEDALERFLLNRSGNQELENVEKHILACERCITQLESLEPEIARLRTALRLSEEARIHRELAQGQRPSRRGWFTLSSLSWTGAACAALALALTVVPNPALDVATWRGQEMFILPKDRPLEVRLFTTDIPAGPVDVQVVTANGSEIWKGQSNVSHERAEVNLPRISGPGRYFLRLYAQGSGAERELLREFLFEVK
jgi:hypothetical protein